MIALSIACVLVGVTWASLHYAKDFMVDQDAELKAQNEKLTALVSQLRRERDELLSERSRLKEAAGKEEQWVLMYQEERELRSSIEQNLLKTAQELRAARRAQGIR